MSGERIDTDALLADQVRENDMELLRYYATHALTGLLACQANLVAPDRIVGEAWYVADAMLAEERRRREAQP